MTAEEANRFLAPPERLQTAREEVEAEEASAGPPPTPQTRSPSFRLAFADHDFLLREDMRAVRLQLELLKPEILLQEANVESTIVVFGSARIPDPERAPQLCADTDAAAVAAPDDREARRVADTTRRLSGRCDAYIAAREFARIVSEASQTDTKRNYVVVTGGGPGIMEAANRGAHDAGAVSIGLNIVLPHEQAPNDWITPDLCFQFHYFALRKMHFLIRARAVVIFPGGFGTLDELFDVLTLIQTGKTKPMPVLLFDEAYWRRIVNFDALAEEDMISPADRDLVQYVETPEAAWQAIVEFYGERL